VQLRPSRREQAAALIEEAKCLLEEASHADKAIELLVAAIAHDPSWAVPHFWLAKAHVASGEIGLAEAKVLEALLADPGFADAAHLLGQLLCQCDRHIEALPWLREATLIEPDDALFQRDLGVTLLFLGNIPAARQALMRALEINPHSERVLSTLTKMTAMGAGSSDAKRLFEIITDLTGQQDALPIDEQASVLFARARALEDRKDFDGAFAALEQANSLRRRQIVYNVADDEARFARMAEVFSADLFNRQADEGHGLTDDRLIFLVGMPRSGSTLAEQIISAHPDVHGAGEIDTLRQVIERCAGPSGARFPDWASAMNAVDQQAIGQAIAEAMPPGLSGQTRMTIKRLDNFEYVGLIHACLPQATIINCRRDERDCCFSSFTRNFSDSQPFSFDLAELGRYYRAYDQLMAHWHDVLPQGRILDLPYEQLVADLDGWTHRLLDHCGLGWDDACLEFYKSKRVVLTSSAAQVRQPIFDTSIDRWKPFAQHLAPLIEALR
jgi:tetratricopeptide (TPR) repeat protein